MANYLYNGVELPALPEWDKTAYPYAIICESVQESFDGITEVRINLKATKSPQTKIGSFLEANTPICRSYLKDDKWGTPYVDNWFWDYEHNDNIIWSNHDVLYSDGSVYLAASDPVPVGEEPEQPTLTARDLYRKINGKPTKLTLYKKLGGKLIPLDEHTKEVKT